MACRTAVRPHVGAQLVVGLSGGADSLALLAAAVAEAGPAHVEAVCVDHGLQPGSRAVADAAARTARQFGARARVVGLAEPVDVAGSLEAAARTARYRALAEAADGRDVFVAHTADDQAETLLLGLLRGRATGMSPRAEIEGAQVVRPLLGVRRRQTEGTCAELGLDPWQDPHNANTDFRRVAVRRDLLPHMAEILGGDAVPALAAAAADVAADDEFLTEQARAVRPTHPTEGLDCAELAGLPEPARRRAIAAWLTAHGAPVTRAGLGGIAKLCTHWHGQGPVAVGGRLEVTRVGGRLCLAMV